ncbi:MAG: M15 family metallopeptidase [Synechococcaceae cyanobacterium]|nr:M15 family metallopeptidase [Synechococcaceae cyanobacterium]
MALRPWSPIPIRDNGEPLDDLPPGLLRLEPHPYQSLGAPYGSGAGPFRLRRGVVARLMEAQVELGRRRPGWRLAIFDAWRPLAVQRFMVRHALLEECQRRGLDPDCPGGALREVEELVGRFWAPPSEDPTTPPPHSTGGVVDLTLADAGGVPVAMGGEIDALGPQSEPEHYAAAAAADPAGPEAEWHRRRRLLSDCLASVGFAQHPNEWWHYSHGDQLWAWRLGRPEACYGRTLDG